MEVYRVTTEPRCEGRVLLLRVHRPDEWAADLAAGLKPRYFGVATAFRDETDPDMIEVTCFVLRGLIAKTAVLEIVRLMERAAAGVGFRRYRFERTTADGPAEHLRELPEVRVDEQGTTSNGGER